MGRINMNQLKKGIKIELEHTKSKSLAERIAREHLDENPNYYAQATIEGKNKLVSVMKNKKRMQRNRKPRKYKKIGSNKVNVEFLR